MRWTLPNILTLGRLLAAPGIAVAFLIFSRPVADWLAVILFVSAAATDWIDGRLARAWGMESRFGAMLDPIADKAMVVIALAVLMALLGLNVWIALPVAAILFREVFVSGLREFLGNTAGTLKVTQLAKWKTTLQMIAIAALFSSGLFEHEVGNLTQGMSPEIAGAILNGEVPDDVGLLTAWRGFMVTSWGGAVLLWVAAALTLATGIDYLRKAMPHLKDAPDA
ncbi:CDP-diacylglycerol--glycerol-3-phosphate 3-phosphatidyltransferase [Rhodobacterales bacterium HKCCE2091]|nr:CDP-diacylglycerol--glycerol-3-phosphate 3-phosphatidyltransferase [Rhodobacterales bacterium HKCCE2091]